MAVCKSCHNQIHQGFIVIDKYIETNTGVKLLFERLDNDDGDADGDSEKKETDIHPKSIKEAIAVAKANTYKKKFTKEEEQWLRDLDHSISKKNRKQMFKETWSNTISMGTMNKILNGVY